MSQPIISIENLSKRYRLGSHYALRGGAGFSARNSFAEATQALKRRLRGGGEDARPKTTEFWALRDIDFEVERGKVLGLIGRNGSGKSTLLKILSRIVEPTTGVAHIRGRVASLLEVGTGFHPELSGRENIYLNGAILGMRRREIQRKFDEIVAFSEVEKFLDTPVKRYSSGMFVRLAFAVAAHLEPEILIVDEVLAVGDFAFQKKCLGKMRDVSTGDGRTVLFVSHNMGALNQLCDEGVLLENGRVTMIGPVQDVAKHYMKLSSGEGGAIARFERDSEKSNQFRSAGILGANGEPSSEFSSDEPITIRIEYEIQKPIPGSRLLLHLQNQEGVRVLHSDTRDLSPELSANLGVGLHVFDIVIPPRLLGAATYQLSVDSASRYSGPIDHRHNCCEFTIRELDRQYPYQRGVLGIQLPWAHSESPVDVGAS